ncbi:Orotidine 5'-phosphate decarboxylase [ANME-1 cluster archaeon GoMg3.2]|nr:Orotidine 5'-phosphate decarboxylase [ANME-1 cluster archaeon GoMg3.2]
MIAVVEMTHPGSDEYIQPVSEKIAEMVEDIGVDEFVELL